MIKLRMGSLIYKKRFNLILIDQISIQYSIFNIKYSITGMTYMIIERFHPGKVKMLYKRFDEKGRMMPAGVNYVNSWINEDVTVCYQVMETDSIAKLQEWINHWNDLADFEIVPVITSAMAKKKVLSN